MPLLELVISFSGFSTAVIYSTKGSIMLAIVLALVTGALLGDSFIVRHMLPLLKQVIHSCLNVSCMNKPEPVQSWSGLALVDCLVTLHGLVGFLPKDLVVKELIQVCTTC